MVAQQNRSETKLSWNVGQIQRTKEITEKGKGKEESVIRAVVIVMKQANKGNKVMYFAG